MNQIIVILVILRSWLINIRPSINKIILSCLGLLLSLFLFRVYNQIQSQVIVVDIKSSNNSDLFALDFNFRFKGIFDEKTPHFKTITRKRESYVRLRYLPFKHDTLISYSEIDSTITRISFPKSRYYSSINFFVNDLLDERFVESDCFAVFSIKTNY